MNNLVDCTLKYETLAAADEYDFEPTGVVIVAAGGASRMKGINKILAPLMGVPVIARSALAFNCKKAVSKIVIVTAKSMVPDISRIVDEYNIFKVSDIVIGGDTRMESVKIGFEKLTDYSSLKNVLIHDGARPLVDDGVINRVLKGVANFSAAIPVVPVKDTVKVIGAIGKIESTPKRESLAAAQTPQGFTVECYKKALEAVREGVDYTDDSSVAEAAGIAVYSVEGDIKNIKVTTPEDLRVAESFLENR